MTSARDNFSVRRLAVPLLVLGLALGCWHTSVVVYPAATKSSGAPAGSPGSRTDRVTSPPLSARKANFTPRSIRSPKATPSTQKVSTGIRPKNRPSSPTSKSTVERQRKFVHQETTPLRSRPAGFAVDPYQLLSSFTTRWDFMWVVPTLAEYPTYVQSAFRGVIRFLQDEINNVSRMHRQCDANLQGTTRFLYLIGRLQQQPAYWPSSPIASHWGAARLTAQADARLLQQITLAHEILRIALNDAAEKRLSSEPMLFDAALNFLPDSLSVTETDWVHALNAWLLSLRSPSHDAVTASEQIAAIQREWKLRVVLRNVVPPPPNPLPPYNPLVQDGLPLPQENLAPPRAHYEDQRVGPPQSLGWRGFVPPGAPVRVAADGRVRFVGALRGFQTVVIVEHDQNLFSIYGGLGASRVVQDSPVSEGTIIGWARNETPASIYFEVRDGNRPVPVSRLLGARKPEQVLISAE